VTAALVLLDRAYVAPFATPAGQAALAVVAVLFAGAFWWMHRLSSPAPASRFLPPQADSGHKRGSGTVASLVARSVASPVARPAPTASGPGAPR
jgi:hypothetical protein